MLRRRVSGIIHAGTQDEDSIQILRNAAAHRIPSVVVWDHIEDSEISSISINNFESAYNVTCYLADLGHREIGLLVGPYSKMYRLEERLKGYKKSLEDMGLAFDEERIISVGHSIHQGAEGLHELLRRRPQITAVFAASDVLAFGALHQAKAEGLSVPEDISIVGFDDIEFATFSDPPLTTVRVPGFDMGRNAVEELMDRIDNHRHYARHVSLNAEIIKRKSVKPPKTATA
jgi:DNA-binding LacI/PurR family transcriptional regulator